MNRNQQAVRPRFFHAIIEDDLVLAAPADDSPAPASAEHHGGKPGRSPLLAGIRTGEKASLAEFYRSRHPAQPAGLEHLDQAVAEIGRRATFGFAALLELPVRLAMNLNQ